MNHLNILIQQLARHFRLVRLENRVVVGRVRGVRHRLSQRSGVRHRRYRNLVKRPDFRHLRLQAQRVALVQAEMPLPGTTGTRSPVQRKLRQP